MDPRTHSRSTIFYAPHPFVLSLSTFFASCYVLASFSFILLIRLLFLGHGGGVLCPKGQRERPTATRDEIT